MKKILLLLVIALVTPTIGVAQKQVTRSTTPKINYGANAAAGSTFTHDKVKFYYEVYGVGEPLLVVHGNSGSIADMVAQIAYFRKRYKVIAMDSRSQGKSGDSPVKLTYELMADDVAALIDHLRVGPVNVLGWSDGGIEALLLAMRHPTKVKKIVAMAANLNPTEEALRPEILTLIKSIGEKNVADNKNTPTSRRELALTKLLLEEPNIDMKALQTITAPTLVMAGDHDVIRDEHTVAIFQNIPNSQLAILPNSTHMVPFDDPVLFNSTVERFLRTPFVKRDRISDLFKSLEQMRKH